MTRVSDAKTLRVSHLKATYRHPESKEYLADGGPWDVPSLDALMTEATRRATGPVLLDDTPAEAIDGAGLEARVAALAGGLRAAGVKRGDVVAWQAPNWHEVILLYRACWRLGAVAGPIHHLAGTADVEKMLAILEPAVWLPTEEIRGASSHFVAMLDSATPVTRSPAKPADIAAVLFTSGSTGEPKAALHTQRGFAYKALVMTKAHRLTSSDAVLMPAPLAHVSGLLNGVLLPGVVPMRALLMARWDPEAALELIERDRTTFMIGPPTFFVSLMSAPGFATERVDSLRLISSGGAGVTPAFVEDASARLGAVVKRTYGSTEAPTVTTSQPDDPPERARDTDGRSTGAAHARISDPATGAEQAVGDTGELWLRGPELFVGYADSEHTKRVIDRGWFRTGDLATLDADGWLTIVGRIKDIIIRGGENIAAAEVESVLESHPDVRHAVAVGYPDGRLGERVCVFVVADRPFTLVECREWFERSGIARFKTPEKVIQVDDVPAIGPGKPDRAALRARAAAE